MKKFALTVLSMGLMTAVTVTTGCSPKDDKAKTTTASTVASTVVTTATPAPAASSVATPAIVASTVVLQASAPAPTATVVTPASAAATAATKETTTTTTVTTTTDPTTTAQAAAGQHTPLQADLIKLMATVQNLDKDAQAKQVAMQKELQAKAAKAKTPEQQQALQKSIVGEMINYKIAQKNQLAKVTFSEPRVKAVQSKMLESIESDIKATQIIQSSPTPTPETQKTFTANMQKAQDAGMQARDQLQKLMSEAGMTKQTPNKAKK